MQTATESLPRSTWPGILLASAGAIAFSGKAIIVKLSYRYGVDAVTVIMYRMLFAMPLFLALSWWASRDKPALSARDWTVLFGLGFSGYYLASFLDFAGLQYITANLERLILYLNPTIVLLLGVVLFHRPVTKRQWMALGVSYVGVLVVFGHDIAIGGENVLLGAVLVFGSAASYALYLAYSGEAVKRIGALRITGVATSIACVLCIAQFFILRPVSAMEVAPQVIWLAILNATLCTFVPVMMVMLAIERVGAGVTAQVGMVGPLSTIAMSFLLLGEPFTAWMVAGTVLVLAGVWLLARSKR
ncbi:drug/metabolite transporter (DMT)-like permease [Povalibacter uvarum]|uniref:Drug/metabolite transporter (DMT)-like permease n=1 Tax=Povalibacter uvarum TaxID=732238 RepID=A0A841HTS0_9GAMM|nr:DMT family transporter [Povalibacter uvarum]MBB6095245.1 drug/metabolite transporter (DMT)-like permease [Povalibacter uvarum]